MRAKVYLETTIVSYFANEFSSNLVTAGRQQITRTWWSEQKKNFDVFISPLVVNEAGCGNPEAAKRRNEALSEIAVLGINEHCEQLAESLVKAGLVPATNAEDALHIAVATVHGIDYLLTWNFSHLNNAFLKARIHKAIELQGYAAPTICSPEELTEEQHGI